LIAFSENDIAIALGLATTLQDKEGVAMGTINHGLKVVRRILNLANTE